METLNFLIRQAFRFSNPTLVQQDIWGDLYRIVQAFINGLVQMVTSFMMILWVPLKGLADTFLAWYTGLQQTIMRGWAGVPLWVAVVIIIIVGMLIWQVIRWVRGEIWQWVPEPPKW